MVHRLVSHAGHCAQGHPAAVGALLKMMTPRRAGSAGSQDGLLLHAFLKLDTPSAFVRYGLLQALECVNLISPIDC